MLKDLMAKVRHGWLESFHLLAAMLAVSSAAFVVWGGGKTDKELFLLWAFGIYYLVLLGFLGYFILTFSRKARYAQTIIILDHVVSVARDALTYSESADANKDRLKQYCVELLTSLATALSMVTGVRCRTAIKLIRKPLDAGASYVTTFARDGVSAELARPQDEQEDKKHTTEDNTDFDLLIKAGEDRFFCNDLRDYPNYRNTSIANRGNSKWSLPYVATIVWPINCRVEQNPPNGRAPVQELVGFLCVDAASRKVFDDRFDTPLGSTVAHTLYPVLKKLLNILEK
jgi:hypothetical protein